MEHETETWLTACHFRPIFKEGEKKKKKRKPSWWFGMHRGNTIPQSFSVHAPHWHFMKTSCSWRRAWMMRWLFETGTSTQRAPSHTHTQSKHNLVNRECWHTMYLYCHSFFIQALSPRGVVVDAFSCTLRGFVYAAKFILYKTPEC